MESERERGRIGEIMGSKQQRQGVVFVLGLAKCMVRERERMKDTHKAVAWDQLLGWVRLFFVSFLFSERQTHHEWMIMVCLCLCLKHVTL